MIFWTSMHFETFIDENSEKKIDSKEVEEETQMRIELIHPYQDSGTSAPGLTLCCQTTDLSRAPGSEPKTFM